MGRKGGRGGGKQSPLSVGMKSERRTVPDDALSVYAVETASGYGNWERGALGNTCSRRSDCARAGEKARDPPAALPSAKRTKIKEQN